MNSNSIKAIEVLRQGGIVIFPTDTAFGIGCRVDDEKAIKKLYTLRKRPETQASSLLVSSSDMAKAYVKDIPKDVMDQLITLYWPGALTIVLPSNSERVPELVRGHTETIGVRMPDHTELREIIAAVEVPILGPSANFHGEKTPFEKQDLDPELIKLVDYVMEGNSTQKNVSTVIDCTRTPWKILRAGAVTL